MKIEENKDATMPVPGVALVASSRAEPATNLDTLDRLKQACGVTTNTALGQVLGISQASVAQAKAKGEIPPGWIVSVSYKHGVSADWLLYGQGPMYAPKRTKIERARAGLLRAGDPLAKIVVREDSPRPQTIECDACQITMIPMVEARLSAGNGSFEAGDGVERHYAFRTDFLTRRGTISRMVLMRVSGDSMEPDIKDGDVVLIDQNQATPTPGKLYAVSVDDMVYIKVVNAQPGKLILTSANKLYPPLDVDTRGDLADSVRIVGRAVWVGRELR